MALWDLLKNIGNKGGGSTAITGNGNGSNLFSNLLNSFGNNNQNNNSNSPQLQAIQLDENGEYDPVKSAEMDLQTQQAGKPLTLSDRLFGREMTKDIQTVNPTTGEATLQTITNYKPGFLTDLSAGMDENYNNKFNINNLGNTITADGRPKGAAYRIGEGLGSFARGLATWGGDAFTAGYNGLDAGLQRQSVRTGDQLYRQQLKDNYGYTDDDLNKIQGFISRNDFNTLANNVYKNQALQVRQAIAGAQDNTKRANMIMQGLNNGTITPDEAKLHMMNYGITFEDLQKSNASRNADMNEQLLPYKQYALQMSPQIAMGNLGLAQQRFNYQQQQDAFNNALKVEELNSKNNKPSAAQKDAQSTLNQIQLIRSKIKANPNATGLTKGFLTGDLINRVDSKSGNIETRAAIDALKTKIRHDLTGAQFSPKEAREYEKFLPNTRDSKEIIEAKLNALEQRYQADFGVSLMGNNKNNNPLGLNL